MDLRFHFHFILNVFLPKRITLMPRYIKTDSQPTRFFDVDRPKNIFQSTDGSSYMYIENNPHRLTLSATKFFNRWTIGRLNLSVEQHTRVVPESRRLFMLQENYAVYCNRILLVNSSIISVLSCKILQGTTDNISS